MFTRPRPTCRASSSVSSRARRSSSLAVAGPLRGWSRSRPTSLPASRGARGTHSRFGRLRRAAAARALGRVSRRHVNLLLDMHVLLWWPTHLAGRGRAPHAGYGRSSDEAIWRATAAHRVARRSSESRLRYVKATLTVGAVRLVAECRWQPEADDLGAREAARGDASRGALAGHAVPSD